MTPKEFEESIDFKEIKLSNCVVLTGTLLVGADISITHEALADVPDVREHAKKQIKRMLLRRIYEDQRQAFYRAIIDLDEAPPFDYRSRRDAQGRLLELATNLQPIGLAKFEATMQ